MTSLDEVLLEQVLLELRLDSKIELHFEHLYNSKL